jgi:hypothetical protein
MQKSTAVQALLRSEQAKVVQDGQSRHLCRLRCVVQQGLFVRWFASGRGQLPKRQQEGYCAVMKLRSARKTPNFPMQLFLLFALDALLVGRLGACDWRFMRAR